MLKEENKPYPEFYHSGKPMASTWVLLNFSETADTCCVRPKQKPPREGGEKAHPAFFIPGVSCMAPSYSDALLPLPE